MTEKPVTEQPRSALSPQPPPPPSVLRSRGVEVRLLAGVVGLIAVGWATAALGRVLTPRLALTAWDTNIALELESGRITWLTTASHAVSWLADLSVVAVIVLALGMVSRWRGGSWRWLWLPTVAGAGALAISVAVKVLTARDRPALSTAVVDAYGAAFPSGHAIRAMAVYGALAWLAAAAARRRALRGLAWSAGVLVIVGVGFARIYLGAHWFTDVLAGFVLGGLWLAIVLVVTRAWSVRAPATDVGAQHHGRV